MISNMEVDDWLKAHCRLTNAGLVWPNGTLHSFETSRKIVHTYLSLGLQPSTGHVTIELVQALIHRIEGLEQMFTALGPPTATHCGWCGETHTEATARTEQAFRAPVRPRQVGKELDLQFAASVLGVKAGDIIREGDPRMNLVQDLIEGDGRRHDWARQLLVELEGVEPRYRAEYIADHPYTEGD